MATDSKQAFAALAAGDPARAVQLFEQILQASPDDPTALLGLARTQLARRAFDAARVPLERLVRVEPSHTEAKSHLAMLDAIGGDDGAIDRLRALAQRADAGFSTHFNLGLVLASNDDLDEAEQALVKAIELEPASVHALIESAQLNLRRNDFATAIQRLQSAAALAPNLSLPHALLARAFQGRGERGKALASLAEAIRRAPTEKPLFEQLYRLCLESGAPKQAAGAAGELLRLDPKNVTYLVWHGEALLLLSRFEEAKKSFLTALELEPDAYGPPLGLGRVARASKDREQARVWLQRAVKSSGKDVRPAHELAELSLEEGRDDEAVTLLEKALATQPEAHRSHYLLARALRTKDRSKAVGHAKKAALSPEPELKDRAESLLRELV